MTFLSRLDGTAAEIFFFIVMIIPIAVASWLYVRQDFSGKNRHRVDLIREKFGRKYSVSFPFATMTLRAAPGQEPDEDDGFEIARLYWADEGRFRRLRYMPGLVMSNGAGVRRFVFMPATADGAECVVSLKLTKGLFGYDRAVSKAVPLA